MSEEAPEAETDDITEELSDWIRHNWDPDMTLGEWWERLAFARYAVPHWPTEWFGRGWSLKQTQSVMATLRRWKVPGPPAGLGVMLAGPTILVHGSREQKERFLPDIVTVEPKDARYGDPATDPQLQSAVTYLQGRLAKLSAPAPN